MKQIAAFTLVPFLAFATPVLSQTAPSVNGKITKIDADTGKITIDHQKIPNLDMPAMTMVFKAADPAMLKAVKPGDKVKFTAESVNGQITVTKVEKAK